MDKRALAIALLCFAAFSIIVMVSADALADDVPAEEEPSEPEPILRLTGSVYQLAPLEDPSVLADVSVTTWMSADKEYEIGVKTDRNGIFTVEYNENVKYISFSMPEYTVKDWCSELYKTGEAGMYEIRLKDDSQVNGTHYLYDNSGHTVLMSRSVSTVYGNVTTILNESVMPLSNAEVVLTSAKETLTTTTDDSGYFSITCSSGVTYDLIVKAGGFENYTPNGIQPSDVGVSIELTQKTHYVLFGMDLAHTMAVFGLIIALLIALAGGYLVRRPEKENGIYVVNDLNTSEEKKRKRSGSDQF